MDSLLKNMPEYLKVLQKPEGSRPTGKGVGLLKGETLLSEEEKEKQQLLNRAFNYQLLLIFYLLKFKFPNNIKQYERLENAIKSRIKTDPSYPINTFAEQTKKYRGILKKCTEENVREFIETSKKVPMLDVLEISKLSVYMNEEDWKTLYKPLSTMVMLIEVKESVPNKLMNAIEDIALRMESEGIFTSEIAKDDNAVKSLVQKQLVQDESMQNLMIEMVNEMQKQFEDSGEFPLPLLNSQLKAMNLRENI